MYFVCWHLNYWKKSAFLLTCSVLFCWLNGSSGLAIHTATRTAIANDYATALIELLCECAIQDGDNNDGTDEHSATINVASMGQDSEPRQCTAPFAADWCKKNVGDRTDTKEARGTERTVPLSTDNVSSKVMCAMQKRSIHFGLVCIDADTKSNKNLLDPRGIWQKQAFDLLPTYSGLTCTHKVCWFSLCLFELFSVKILSKHFHSTSHIKYHFEFVRNKF